MKRFVGIASVLALALLSPKIVRSQRRHDDNSAGPRQAYSVQGTVRFEENGRGAEMVNVTLLVLGGAPVNSVFTDSTGDFVFGSLLPGAYLIVVDQPGYEKVQQEVAVEDGPRIGILLYLRKTGETPPGQPGATVTAHQLSVPERAGRYYQNGLKRLAKKDAQGSLKEFRSAIAEYPAYYEAYYQMGVAETELGQNAQGEQAYRKAIELSNGHFAEADFGLASLLSSEQKFSQAETVVREGLALDAKSWSGHFELARALLGMNRVDEADKSVEASLQARSDYAPAYLLLANIHIRKHDYSALKKDLDEYLKLEPSGPKSDQARRIRQQVEQVMAKAQKSPPPASARP